MLDNGSFKEIETISLSAFSMISTLEAIMIEIVEPVLNRRRGDDFSSIEFIQVISPEIKDELAKIDLLKQLVK